jgi:hypothetical protein
MVEVTRSSSVDVVVRARDELVRGKETLGIEVALVCCTGVVSDVVLTTGDSVMLGTKALNEVTIVLLPLLPPVSAGEEGDGDETLLV